MIDTVIFDMDGVICHTNPYHEIAFDEFFKRRNMQASEEDYLHHMYGKSNSYIFSYFFGRPIRGEELHQYESEKEQLFRDIYADVVSPIDGFMPFLEGLVTRNMKLGVATSAPAANRDLILQKLGIEGVFGSLMASEDVQEHKPAPEVYLTSAKNLQSDATTCLVFEDSHSGVTAGLRAGMGVIGVLSSHTADELPACKRYISTYDDSLLDYLADLSAI